MYYSVFRHTKLFIALHAALASTLCFPIMAGAEAETLIYEGKGGLQSIPDEWEIGSGKVLFPVTKEGTPSASNNKVTVRYDPIVNDDSIDPDLVLGGVAKDGTIEGNVVNMEKGSVSWVIGGFLIPDDSSAATEKVIIMNNIINIEGGSVESIMGAFIPETNSDTVITNNTITMNGGEVGEISGGRLSSKSRDVGLAINGTIITVNGGTVDRILGGQIYGAHAAVTDNEITVNGNTAKVSGISGGVAGDYFSTTGSNSSSTKSNKVTVNGSTVEGEVYGGQTEIESSLSDSSGPTSFTFDFTTIAADNNVTVSGDGLVEGDVYGGHVNIKYENRVSNTSAKITGSASAKGNTVTISKLSKDSSVYGGYVSIAEGDPSNGGTLTAEITAKAIKNIVTVSDTSISDTPKVTAGSLYGGYLDKTIISTGTSTITSNLFTGNTLNLKTNAVSVKGLHNFQYLNFTLPENIANTTPMLTVEDAPDYGGDHSGNLVTLDIRTPS
ncbi:MAG: hypothetical protein LBD06_03680, partial [Candidatus Accumulibacter sp.]|nr:hypothetical protein [Accumulibacter sp.]